MPLPPGLHQKSVTRRGALRAAALLLGAAWPDARIRAARQDAPADTDLARASGQRVVRVGSAQSTVVGHLPLEVYVARVLAGEGEPRARGAAQEALAIAIRTFLVANPRRHARNGYDVCDSTHCQVLRASTAASRTAALVTSGRILTFRGAPAEVFYSASCGGRSEAASSVWPAADFPYLQPVEDDVHDADLEWALDLTLLDVQQVLLRSGFSGARLRAVSIMERNASGRVASIHLNGLGPNQISGQQFRLAVGPARLKSTAFQLEREDDRLRFTGRGYGHGVGLCVVGAGRRAQRGETVEAILHTYFPGLELATLGRGPAKARGLR